LRTRVEIGRTRSWKAGRFLSRFVDLPDPLRGVSAQTS